MSRISPERLLEIEKNALSLRVRMLESRVKDLEEIGKETTKLIGKLTNNIDMLVKITEAHTNFVVEQQKKG